MTHKSSVVWSLLALMLMSTLWAFGPVARADEEWKATRPGQENKPVPKDGPKTIKYTVLKKFKDPEEVFNSGYFYARPDRPINQEEKDAFGDSPLVRAYYPPVPGMKITNLHWQKGEQYDPFVRTKTTSAPKKRSGNIPLLNRPSVWGYVDDTPRTVHYKLELNGKVAVRKVTFPTLQLRK